MALPAKKKRGLRVLTHKGTRYYWKVKYNAANAELDILIGLESVPSACFHVHVSFVDPSLYGPWLAAAQAQGKAVTELNERDHIGPGFIVEAIAFADAHQWQEKKGFSVLYQDGGFHHQGQ